MYQHDKKNLGINLFSKEGDIMTKVKGLKMKSICAGQQSVLISLDFRVSTHMAKSHKANYLSVNRMEF